MAYGSAYATRSLVKTWGKENALLTTAHINKILWQQASPCIFWCETAGAIETSLGGELLSADQVGWALIGIVRSLEKTAKDVDEMVQGAMGICKTIESL